MGFGKQGEAGIGTLILFIAMILVAAVAAGVLIQTSSSLQSKALATGSQARDQVTTSAQFLNIYADDASSDSDLENVYIEMKLVPGSDIIKLSDAIMEVSLNNQSQALNFSNTGECTGLSNSQFTVNYEINGTNNIDEYLVSGDVVTLCFQSPRDIQEDEKVDFVFIPKTGAITTATVTTPSVMTDKTVYLYP